MDTGQKRARKDARDVEKSDTPRKTTDGRTDEDGDDDGRSIVVFASSMDGRVSVDVIVIDGVDIVDVDVGGVDV